MTDYEHKLLRIVCALLASGDYTTTLNDKPCLIWHRFKAGQPAGEYPVLRDAADLLDELESDVKCNQEIEASILLEESEKARMKAEQWREEREKRNLEEKAHNGSA